MMYRFSFFLLALVVCINSPGQKPISVPQNSGQLKASHKIIVEVENMPVAACEANRMPNNDLRDDSLEVSVTSLADLGLFGIHSVEYKASIVNCGAKWILSSEQPLFINSRVFKGVLSPGDSVHIRFYGDKAMYSGNGAQPAQFYDELRNATNILSPTKATYDVRSLHEYLQWNKYLDDQLVVVRNILDSYREKIAAGVYQFMEHRFISNIETDRADAFQSFVQQSTLNKNSNVKIDDLKTIYDSTLHKPSALWLRSLSDGYPSVHYYLGYLRCKIRHRFDFDMRHDSLVSNIKREWLYYQAAKNEFEGTVREMVLGNLVADQILKWSHTERLKEVVVNDYYNQSKYPRHMAAVKSHEAYRNGRGSMVAGRSIHDFNLVDQYGRQITKKDLNGKVVVMDFWHTGCSDCAGFKKALKQAEEKFRKDTNVVFMHLSADRRKEVWRRSLAEKKYTTGKGIDIFMNGQDYNIAKAFNVISYPRLHLLSAYGINSRIPFEDHGSITAGELIGLIDQQLAISHDGPYVLYRQDSVVTYEVDGYKLYSRRFKKNDETIFRGHTDQSNRFFKIQLKKTVTAEPAEYSMPRKLFALSDIEGNFDSFRKLLQAHKIIDANFNWIFGDGHLVLAGDMFDRGYQVTECLWLIYTLEEKAKAVGGYVHFILGNHEIMNMQGNESYVQEKYKHNARAIGKTIRELYSENSELGRWLRTKNIMEKIGDILFVHGGITPEVNRLPLNIAEMNNLARPYYSGSIDSTNLPLLTLFETRPGEKYRISPFWARGYYRENAKEVITRSQLDSTLKKFNVNRVVTGHTILADTISTWYNGKVINTDTHHAGGKSEALLIIGQDYYRADVNGRRILLFRNREPLVFNQSK